MKIAFQETASVLQQLYFRVRGIYRVGTVAGWVSPNLNFAAQSLSYSWNSIHNYHMGSSRGDNMQGTMTKLGTRNQSHFQKRSVREQEAGSVCVCVGEVLHFAPSSGGLFRLGGL